MKTRLSIMMFLQYMVPAFVFPILSHYLKNTLGIDPFRVGVITAMTGISAMVMPFFVAHVADRVVSAERLLGLFHLAAGLLMLVIARQTTFYPILGLYFLYGLMLMPTFALTNAVAFHHVTDAKRDFGGIRMWGPISWVIGAWAFSLLWLGGASPSTASSGKLGDALVVCAVFSLILAVYAFTLPRSGVKKDEVPAVLSGKTFRIFLRPSLLLLCGAALVNAMVHQFYYWGMSPYLHQIGVSDTYIMPVFTLGQMGEVVALGSLGFFMRRFGVKKLLVMGAFAQTFRAVVFAIGWKPLVFPVIPTHGICYAFFFIVAYIYVETHSTAETRSGAQQLFNILIMGLGDLGGKLLAGGTAALFLTTSAAGESLIDFGKFWLVSGTAAFVVGLALLFFFHEETETDKE